MAFRAATQEHRAVMLAAVSAGLIADTMSARSHFMNEVKRDLNGARAKVLAPSAAVPVAASSVKSTDKPRTPAVVSRERVKPSSGTKSKVTSERLKPYTQPVEVSTGWVVSQVRAALELLAATTTEAPTVYPSLWARGHGAVSAGAAVAGAGRSHRAATITASGQTGAQRATQAHQAGVTGQRVHAAGDTGRTILAERQRQTDQVAAAQHNRAGHYDTHDLIAAAGDNAKRIQDAQLADQARMAREQAARASRPLGR